MCGIRMRDAQGMHKEKQGMCGGCTEDAQGMCRVSRYL